jgi:hypothetical protein
MLGSRTGTDVATKNAATSAAIAASTATQIHQLDPPLLREAAAFGRAVGAVAGRWCPGVESSGNACQSL